MSLAANVGMMTMMSGGPMCMMMMMSRGGAMGSMMGGIGMGMPGIAGLNALNPSLGGMRMMGMASSMNMGGAMGFSQTTPNAAATPANPEAAKAWQGAVDEMTKAVTLQVKK